MKKVMMLLCFAAIAAQAEFVRGWLTTTLPTGEETVEVEDLRDAGDQDREGGQDEEGERQPAQDAAPSRP
jgi:hypothetical protein